MKNTKIAAIIPARMGSTRFPGKPLMKIHGLSMIEHVRRRVELAKGLSHVIVATCDKEIKNEVERFGGKVIMTSPKHERATDRVEEAAHALDVDIVINVQGDEPMIEPAALEKVVEPYIHGSQTSCSCLVYPLKNFAELPDLNIVKVVLSKTGRVLYLSRAGIPGKEPQNTHQYFKQSGIMAFRKDFLPIYQNMPMTPLEIKESVDLLRILENDLWVQGVVVENETIGVDVPEQIGQVEQAMTSSQTRRELLEKVLQQGL